MSTSFAIRRLSGPGLLAAALVAGSTLAAPAEGPDGAALELLREVRTALLETECLTAELTLYRWEAGKRVLDGRGTVRLLKPNYARVELDGGRRLLVSDGATFWQVDRAAGFYQKAPAGAQGERIDLPEAPILSYFFVRQLYTLGTGPGQHLVRSGTESLEGAAYRFLELGEPAAGSFRLYIGPDGLPRRAHEMDARGAPAREAVLSEVDLRVRWKAADFVYQPPAGALHYDPHDPSAVLLPVGARAPDLVLNRPEGGRLRLSDAWKRHKALLINFWFYG